MKEYRVKLTYFKKSGKYYTDGEYMTSKLWMYEIIDEVKEMKRQNKLPGIGGLKIHIEVEEEHPNGYPCLIL